MITLKFCVGSAFILSGIVDAKSTRNCDQNHRIRLEVVHWRSESDSVGIVMPAFQFARCDVSAHPLVSEPCKLSLTPSAEVEQLEAVRRLDLFVLSFAR